MARPLIGITTYAEPEVRWGAWKLPAALIPLAYVEAIERAGGRALLVPPSEEGIEETLDALDGLLFSGGSDLDPETYGQEAHRETTGVRAARDVVSSSSLPPRSTATCRSSPCAGARSC